MASPKPKPTALKILQGNPGRRPLNKREPKPKKSLRCPAGLSPRARTEWRRLAPELFRLGLLTMADQVIFAMYCETSSVFFGARKKADYEKRNGAMISMEKAWGNARSFAALFGLSPSDRVRLTAATEEDDDLDEFLFGIQQ